MKLLLKILCCIILLLSIPAYGAAISREEIVSSTAVLMDAETGQVLFDKDMSKRVYPASTTKIMTCLLVTEHCQPDEIVTVTQNAVDIDEWDSANVGLEAGEQLTVGDLLYALMLPSGNDAANALAEHAAGSQEQFVEWMNLRAAQIGAKNTHFANAHGLHDPEHYTTAYDLALITQCAAQNPEVMRYFGAETATVAPTNRTPLERKFQNYQSMLVRSSDHYNKDVLAGKVGFTNEAKHTMSTVAARNGRTLICVVMHSENRTEKFTDTQILLDYGFSRFRSVTLPAALFDIGSVPIGDGEAAFSADCDFTALLRDDLDENQIAIKFEIEEADTVDAPLPSHVAIEIETPDTTLPALLGKQPLVTTITLGQAATAAFRFQSATLQEQTGVLQSKILFALLCVIASGLTVTLLAYILWRKIRKNQRINAINQRIQKRYYN